MLAGSSLRDCVTQSLPSEFLSALLRAIVKGNRAATKMCMELPAPQRRDVYGHVERGFIEAELYRVAGEFSDVSATNRTNSAGTSNYVEIRRGRVVLTSSAVDSAMELPRAAQFRSTLAVSGQEVFAWFKGESPEPADGCVHVVLTHCTTSGGLLHDAGLVVPDVTGKQKLWSTNLSSALGDAIREEREALEAAEEQVKEVEPQLRVPAKKQRKEA